jgi:hypothetical protein
VMAKALLSDIARDSYIAAIISAHVELAIVTQFWISHVRNILNLQSRILQALA